MNRFRIKSLILGLMLFSASPSYAVDLKNVAMFGLGFASGTVFHEVGHATVGWLQGGEVKSISFSETVVKYDSSLSQDEINKKARFMTLGGYMAQSVATEIILQNKNWHKNDYALGWMSLGVFVNLSNPIRYYIFNQHDNDLGYYEKAGGDPLIPTLFMVAHAGFTIYRIFSDTDIPVHLGNNTLGLTFKF